jgi:hypothetical protein
MSREACPQPPPPGPGGLKCGLSPPNAADCSSGGRHRSATTRCGTRTTDLYRYVDCTEQAEFLYECVGRAVEHDLPREIDYLRRRDEAIQRIMDAVEMPDRVAEDLVLRVSARGCG